MFAPLRSRGSPAPTPNLRTITTAQSARSNPAASGAPTRSHTDATSVEAATTTGAAIGGGDGSSIGGGADVCDAPAVILGGAAGAGGAATIGSVLATARSYDSNTTSLSCRSAPAPVTSIHATRFQGDSAWSNPRRLPLAAASSKKSASTGTATGVHADGDVPEPPPPPVALSLYPRAAGCDAPARSSRTSSEAREPRALNRRTFQARESMSNVDASASAPHGASCAHIMLSPAASTRPRSLTQSHCEVEGKGGGGGEFGGEEVQLCVVRRCPRGWRERAARTDASVHCGASPGSED